MRLRAFLLSLVLCLVSGVASAELAFEQDCRYSKKTLHGDTSSHEGLQYTRRIFVQGDLLAFQIIVGRTLMHEYGFDFERRLYYEWDPLVKRASQYPLDRLNKEFKQSRALDLMSPAGMGPAAALLESAGARGDYPVKAARSLFASKKVGTLHCQLYRVKWGPGYSVLRSSGWDGKAQVWVAKDIPHYAEYENAAKKLKAGGAFYKAKSNEISDLVIFMTHAEGFPVEVYSATRRGTPAGRLEQRDHGVLTALSAVIKDTQRPWYFKERGETPSPFPNEVLPVFFPVPAETGPLSWVIGFFNLLYTILVPVLFFSGLIYWCFQGGFTSFRFELGRKLALRLYGLVTFLFILQLLHTFAGAPYLHSMAAEFSLLAAGGAFLLLVNHNFYLRKFERELEEQNVRKCPTCKLIIDRFYRVCPQCNGVLDETLSPKVKVTA